MSFFLLFFDMLITQIIIITIHFTWATQYHHLFLPRLEMETILRFYFGLKNIRMMICGMQALPTQSDWAVSVYISPTESSFKKYLWHDQSCDFYTKKNWRRAANHKRQWTRKKQHLHNCLTNSKHWLLISVKTFKETLPEFQWRFTSDPYIFDEIEQIVRMAAPTNKLIKEHYQVWSQSKFIFCIHNSPIYKCQIQSERF